MGLKIPKISQSLILLVIFVFAIFSGIIIHRATWFVQDKHFSILAESFIKNDLFLSPYNLPPGDFADYQGRQYLFFGPLPSVILMPFVYIWGRNFPQIYLSFFSLVLTFIAIFQISKKLKFSSTDSLWLANFFVFGTVLYFVGLIDISAYLPQAVGTAFMVLSILEYFTKRRFLLIGILIAAAGATRVTLFGITLFYLFEIFQNRKNHDFKKEVALLLIPVVFSLVLLGAYNLRRFHSPFDTGYTKNVTVLDKNYLNNQLGWFSPVHIPANLYNLLLRGPDPVLRENVEMVLKFPYLKADGMGLAIWYTSPLFLYIIAIKRASHTKSAVVGLVALAFPSLIYMGIGASQYGYRYSLDFIPLLFLILLPAFNKKLSTPAKALIATGIVINCFYMLSIWNSYPLLTFWEYLK
ncbi:MAG: hypothetical protein UT84_C0010G0015 [Candidatus Curtissbacteria bacterium GW2011_GWA1_40_16]|uniref:Glycosyltransferase RgtA/B/C/D-like domain-containing protein n=1 Tax=Candidatus Curtissbacteria bacterium GW2011_GWA1_40_16 TaxID=1618405 RepID=A0A0G0UK29_9BACT|nr:MAG: hypothetical protein UT84_C0010G0015 [Candidatus Curtissbacteria bacterium GW2011_GWA1_40_16]